MGNMIGEYNAHCQLKDLFVDLVKQPTIHLILFALLQVLVRLLVLIWL
jgi:hypothetical protein